MDDLGRVLIRMPARRVGSPFFLLLLVLMAAGAFGFAGLKIGFLCTAAIAVVAVAFGLLWNRGIRLATVHERGIALKGGGRPRSITWDRIQRIDRRLHESAYARMTFFDVVACGPGADPVKVTLTPAADGPELVDVVITAITRCAGLTWFGDRASRQAQTEPPAPAAR